MASEEFQRAMANIQKLEQRQPFWRTGNPPEPGKYLITYQSDKNKVSIADYEADGWDIINGKSAWGDRVIAWMPLPEPYQGE